MVAIRLARTGAKKKPSYRVVVMDKRRARDSRNIEIVGHYNPRPDPIELVLKRDRIDYWLGVGAQPSDTVKRLLKHFDKHGHPLADEESKNGVQTEPAPKQVAVPEEATPSSLEPEVPVEESLAESAETTEQTPAMLDDAVVAKANQLENVPAETEALDKSSGEAPAGASEPSPTVVQADQGARE
jgi:small subunit ribosomal protein S16